MIVAPDTGRTAEENELREALARFLWDTRYGQLPDAPWGAARQLAKAIPDGAAASAVCAIWSQADALLSSPLAPILQEAATARKERDEARRQMHQNMVPISKDGTHVFVDGTGDVPLDWSQGQDLIALAKMYGEACRDLVYARSSEDDLFWQKEEAIVALSRKLVAAEAEAAQLRSRLLEAEKGEEISGRDPSGPGYSGFAPSPMVSASGEYPSRSQAGMIKRLTKAYRRNDWPTMSEGGKIFALNRMTDALRKVGFGLVALGIEAEGQDAKRLDALHENPSALGGMPDPLSPEPQEAGDGR